MISARSRKGLKASYYNEKQVYFSFKISEATFRQLVRLFCVDLTAIQLTRVTSLNRNTINRLLQGIRKRIAFVCEAESPISGEIEGDERLFWCPPCTRTQRSMS